MKQDAKRAMRTSPLFRCVPFGLISFQSRLLLKGAVMPFKSAVSSEAALPRERMRAESTLAGR